MKPANNKIKIKDDADMITMADQDDLDMAIESARSVARREKSDMGKMEVSLTNHLYGAQYANMRL